MATNSFDDKAATWDDDPAKVERARAVAGEIRAAIHLDGTERLLEYGAGTGLVTEALQDAVGPVTLVDTSAGMLDVMRAKVDAGTIPDARVWELDLVSGPVPDERFDLVVTVMTLHHIEDLSPVLIAFRDLLDRGGHLCIADLEAEDGSFHTDDFHGHNGFERADLEAQLTQAGFTDIAFRDCYRIDRGGVDYLVFLATCTRGAPSVA